MRLFAFLFGMVLVSGVFAQEEDLSQMLDKALVLNINTKLVSEANKVNWSFSVTKITIPGKPVAVQLNGKNLKVYINFTPYKEEKEQKAILVAQGQIWLQETSTGEGKYLTTLKTIPVAIGEKIKYYPLGVGDSSEYTIELEIEIIPYSDLKKSK